MIIDSLDFPLARPKHAELRVANANLRQNYPDLPEQSTLLSPGRGYSAERE